MIIRHSDMTWLQSDGGPLILLASAVISEWHGYLPPENRPNLASHSIYKDARTDYERACSVGDLVGVIDVGDQHALVLGDEPLMTCWQPSSDAKGGAFVRWICAENVESVSRTLKVAIMVSFETTPYLFEVGASEHYLFDAATPGVAVNLHNSLRVSLQAGVYSIETAQFEPDPATALLIHRLRRNGD